ncbi:MAG TPA: hydroxymethylglutaryl-CoA lyase [Symbiobacteriaceae bacterium]|jgi:hydroxymethylglutaryl-CoA lyase
MNQLPKRVEIVEVGPRDGFQNVREWIPTAVKVEMVNRLSRTGIRELQVTSFVHPRAVPQLRDAEEVLSQVERLPGIIYEALVPNVKGAERAIAAGVDKIKLMLSVTDSHSLANANATTEEALARLEPVAALAHEHGVALCGGLAAALGCPYEGFPPAEGLAWVVDRYLSLNVHDIVVSDTSGMANPVLVYDRLSRLRDRYPQVSFGLHLHDTRRMAAANVLAALQAGITRFDGAVGGLGGCPYCPDASGNIATEDLVHMLHEMGIETGVDLEALMEVARYAREHIPHPLDSAMLRAGPSRNVLGSRTEGQSKLG